MDCERCEAHQTIGIGRWDVKVSLILCSRLNTLSVFLIVGTCGFNCDATVIGREGFLVSESRGGWIRDKWP
jgi:hypothetical protein